MLNLKLAAWILSASLGPMEILIVVLVAAIHLCLLIWVVRNFMNKKWSMTEILRRVLTVVLLVLVMLFCIYGFMATYEPLPRNVQITWRVVYGGLIAACLAGITRQAFPRRPKP